MDAIRTERPRSSAGTATLPTTIRLVLAIVLVLLTGISGTGLTATAQFIGGKQPQPAGDVTALVEQGDQLTLQSRFEDAEAKYSEAVRAAPTNPLPYVRWSRLLAFDMRPLDALARAQFAVQIDPANAEAYARLARAHDWLKQYTDALMDAQQAITFDPNYAEGYAFLAEIYLDMGQLALADAQATRAIQLDPNNAEAHRSKAFILTAQNDLDGAIKEAERAAQLQPTLWMRFDDLATLLRLVGDHTQAIAFYQRAIDLRPKAASYTGMALSQMAQNDLPPALASLQSAVTLDPGYAQAQGALGLVYAEMGQCAQAAPYIQKALQLDPALAIAKQAQELCPSGAGVPVDQPTSGPPVQVVPQVTPETPPLVIVVTATSPAPVQPPPAVVPQQPTYGPLKFCAYFDDAGNPVDTRTDFPFGTMEIHPYWTYAGVQPGTAYNTVWYDHVDGSSTPSSGVLQSTSGLQYHTLTRSQGSKPILAGTHTYSVQIGGQTTLSADFTVSPSAPPLQPRPVSGGQAPAVGGGTLSGRIAYPVFDVGRKVYDIYLANADGSNRQRIIGEASCPDLSPDGTQITYRSWDDGGRAIFARKLDGSQQRALTENTFLEDMSPKWSPSGDLIVFASLRESDRRPRIYLANPGGHNDWVIQRGGEAAFGETPAWLPDGRIVYNACLGNSCGLVVMNRDGGGAQLITTQPPDKAPAAAPDGSRIAFMSQRDGNWELYAIDPTGGNLQRLTTDPANDGLPVWSPDGRSIAFASDRGGAWALWVMNADGSNQRQIFTLEGPIDGHVRQEQDFASRGWTDEHISWIP